MNTPEERREAALAIAAMRAHLKRKDDRAASVKVRRAIEEKLEELKK